MEKRNKPTSKLSVKKIDDKVISVSEEEYPFMNTDGYNTKITREMQWNKDKLIEEVASIKEVLIDKETEKKEQSEKVNDMSSDLDEIKKLRQWKQVKANWKIYSQIYGGIVKENKLLQEETKLKQMEAKIKYEKKLVVNYEEVLKVMEE